jgi:hypothetical protein
MQKFKEDKVYTDNIDKHKKLLSNAKYPKQRNYKIYEVSKQILLKI